MTNRPIHIAMKPTLLPAGVALLFLLGLGLAQDPPPADKPDETLARRVEVLEGEVLVLKKEVQAQHALAEETNRYLTGAKERSDALLKVLDEAVAKGFIAGINFESREILVAGWRAYLNGEAEGLPAPKKAEPAKGPGK